MRLFHFRKLLISRLTLLAFFLLMLPLSLAAQFDGSGKASALFGQREWGIVQLGVYGNLHSFWPFTVEPGVRLGIGIFRHHTAVAVEAGSIGCEDSENCPGREPTYRLRFEYSPQAMEYVFAPYYFASHMWLGDELKGFGGGSGYMWMMPDLPIRVHLEAGINFLNGTSDDGTDQSRIHGAVALGVSALL